METRTLSALFQAGPIESTDIVGFRSERRLGRIAETEIELRSTTYVEPDELLGLPARLSFGRGEGEHQIDGVVMSVTLVSTPEDDARAHVVYRLHVTSLLGLLEREVDCRIFQDKDVKEIVGELLADLGIEAKRQAWRLAAKYPKREYCVQYNESALAFVSRLLEEEGIYFSSDKDDDGELLVFEDDSTLSDPIEGESTIRYRHGAGFAAMAESIGVITQRHRTATGQVVLRDYHFKKPELDLTVKATADRDADLEIYDYPGLYTDAGVGTRLAQVRLEALQAERVVLELESGCPRLIPGRWFSLTDTPNELDGDWLCTGAVHELTLGIYAVRATVIPKKVKYRTPQITKAPVIDGPQTAEIVAPAGSPAEEIHTDKHGRCKVLFHWDRYGKHDDTASCWMRIAQQQTSGSMILPRVGWEVIVEFLEGNPDRPFVTGRVWNGRFMPPYALPEGKSRTTLQTASSPGGGGRNEIRMEDKAGAEEVKIGAQKNTTLATGNNKTKSTAVNETKNVGVDATLSVGANQTVKVTNGYKSSVAAAQSASVGGNRTVEVNAVYGLTAGGASATTVGGNQMEMDGNPIKALLALAVKAATDAAKAQAKQAMAQLDAAVSAKANQVLGPIKDLQAKAEQVHSAMEAVSKGDLSGAAGALGAAAGLPTPSDFGESLLGGGGESTGKGGGGGGAGDGMTGKASKGGAGGDPGDGGDSGGMGQKQPRGGAAAAGGGDAGGGGGGGGGASDSDGGGMAQKQPRGGAAAGGGEPAAGGAPESLGVDSADHASAALGLDTMVNGAIDSGADALGDALGLDGAGGGGESEANKVGPDGAVGGNGAGDSATGPGHSVNVCSATHAEDVGGIKATIAAAGIHTTIKGARSQKIAAARIELVGGNRVETCLADKIEKAVGLVVISGSPESEDVGGSRSTMVGEAIIDKVGGTQTVTAGGKAMFVGAFHKIDAGEAIVFKCGSSEVVIDAAGVTIKATLVTITASDIVLTAAVSQA